MIDLRLTRFLRDSETTLGMLRLDGAPFCFTLEDEHRLVKVPAETRIPAGAYRILPREAGRLHTRYAERFPWHRWPDGKPRGMLHLQMVPGFTHIYIHIGNDEGDTAGCILVGDGARMDAMTLQLSTQAYERLYKRVIDDAYRGELGITIEDRDH